MGERRQEAGKAADQSPTGRRLTVSEAAEHLGISAEAVRSRLKRGTLEGVKDGSTVYVLLTDHSNHDQTRPDINQTATGRSLGDDQTTDRALVEVLEDQVAYLREQLEAERESRRRADTIIAQLARANEEQARTIQAIEAPQESQQQPQEAAEAPGGVEPRLGNVEAQEGVPRPQRSIWRRIFGG